MGSAVGQVPEYVEMVTRWCKQHTRMPVLVKLTPNITNILVSGARGQARRRRRRVAHQHHQLDHRRRSRPHGADAHRRRQGHAWRLLRPGGQAHRAAHGGARSRATPNAPACRSPASAASPPGATRRSSWRSGAGTVQVCTAAMHYGFKIVDDMIDGLGNWMDEKGYARVRRLRRQGRAQRHRLAAPQPELQDHRRASTRICASNAASATSPARTPRTRRSPRSARTAPAPLRGDRRANASAAICACTSARSPAASPWSRWRPASPTITWVEHPNNPMRQACRVAARNGIWRMLQTLWTCATRQIERMRNPSARDPDASRPQRARRHRHPRAVAHLSARPTRRSSPWPTSICRSARGEFVSLHRPVGLRQDHA